MPKRTPHGDGWFGTASAARITGVSKPMLDYLCRECIVEPSCSCPRGHGKRRHYSFGDLVALRLVARLSAYGVSPLRLRADLRSMRRYYPEITLTSLPAQRIVTDGKRLFLLQDGDSVERIMDGQLAFAFLVELPKLRDEVKREAERLLVA